MIMEPSSEKREPPGLITSSNPEPASSPTRLRAFRTETREEWTMKLKVVVHVAEEGGYWAEVPAIPGCARRKGTRS